MKIQLVFSQFCHLKDVRIVHSVFHPKMTVTYLFAQKEWKSDSLEKMFFVQKERPIAKGEEDYDGKGIDYKTH